MQGLADIKVTLYDIFGYLLPGLVVLTGAAVFFWAVFVPDIPIHSPTLSGPEWFAVLIAAYILGHLAQALANDIGFVLVRVVGSFKSPEMREFAALAETHQAKLRKATHIHWDETVKEKDKDKELGREAGLLYDACDASVAQYGSTANREIYIYREGFYRGLVVGFSIGLIGLLVRLLVGGAQVQNGDDIDPIPSSTLWFLVCFVAVGIVLTYIRYRRFREFRIKNAFLSYLVLAEEFGKLTPAPAPAGGG
jgi:tetrahydromethanopterin S-methyltransferase subunit B